MYHWRNKLISRHVKKHMPRSAGATLALVLIIGGISYAALTSQRTSLKGNTIQTAIASLQISPDGDNFSSSTAGYAFSALIPGGPAMPHEGFPVYIRNVGTSTLAPDLSVSGPVSNPQNVDLSQVNIILTPKDGGAPQTFSLQSLIDAGSNGGKGLALTTNPTIAQNITQAYLLQVQLGNDAVNGSGFGISNVDLSFGGTAVAS